MPSSNNTSLLLHICCGPCSIRVIQSLMEQGYNITGFFYNPNIQPLAEYMRRREGAKEVCARLGVRCIMADELPDNMQKLPIPQNSLPRRTVQEKKTIWSSVSLPKLPPAVTPYEWLEIVSSAPENRCAFCCSSRLSKTAEIARQKGFSTFSTSLFYSRWQQHDPIKEAGMAAAKKHNIPLHYEDFRKEWQMGITISKEWGIYRQQYCGCLYSEYDRYAKKMQKSLL